MAAPPRVSSPSESPQQKARDQNAYDETYGGLATVHATRARAMAALRQDLVAASRMPGVLRSSLPNITDDMGQADFDAAVMKVGRILGRTPGAQPVSAPTAAPAGSTRGGVAAPYANAAPYSPAINPMASAWSPKTAPKPKPAPIDAFAAPLPPKTAGFGGIQTPATRPDGTQMTNPDGSARYVASQPSAGQALAAQIPGFAAMDPEARRAAILSRPARSPQGVVTDSGVGPRDMTGAATVQGVGGNYVDVDPMKDIRKSWLSAGDPLIGAASRGVVIDPKYVVPGASNIGTFGPPSAAAVRRSTQDAPAANLGNYTPDAGGLLKGFAPKIGLPTPSMGGSIPAAPSPAPVPTSPLTSTGASPVAVNPPMKPGDVMGRVNKDPANSVRGFAPAGFGPMASPATAVAATPPSAATPQSDFERRRREAAAREAARRTAGI